MANLLEFLVSRSQKSGSSRTNSGYIVWYWLGWQK